MPTARVPKIDSFEFRPGRVLAGKYEVLGRIGRGWEGEVYHVREQLTGVERAAKFFFPERNLRDRAVTYHARKLYKLRHCPLLIQYVTLDKIIARGVEVKFMVSELVEGVLLSEFLSKQRGKRLTVFEGLVLLHTLANGLEVIHNTPDYHGDIHPENIMVKRRGIGFDVKLIDFYRWNAPTRYNIREDVYDIIRIFYDLVGGRARYRHHPQVVKNICCGLKRSLIVRKFKTAGSLRNHLETMEWV